MSDYNMGPDLVWIAVPILALIGVIAVLTGIVFGVIWLVNRVAFI